MTPGGGSQPGVRRALRIGVDTGGTQTDLS
jgi:hypothetical protein